MLKEQFILRIALSILAGFVLVVAFWRMAQKNSAEVSPERHLVAKILGGFWGFFAVLCVFVSFQMISKIEYPTQMIEPYISRYTIIRSSSQPLIWGVPTSAQNMALSQVMGIFLSLALFVYCWLFKRSNTKWWQKVGKVIFCILLVMSYFSATEFNYFDIYEFYSTILFAVFAFFAVRQKKSSKSFSEDCDCQVTTNIVEASINQSNNIELETISQLFPSTEEVSESAISHKGEKNKEKNRKLSFLSPLTKLGKGKISPKFLFVSGMVWTIVTILTMLVLACVYDKKEYTDFYPKEYDGYYLYPEYAVASSIPLEYGRFSYVDNRLGNPIFDNDYTLTGGNIIETAENGNYTAYQYFRIVAYDISDKIASLKGNYNNKIEPRDEYLRSLYERLKKEYPECEYIENYCRNFHPHFSFCEGDAIHYFYEVPIDNGHGYYVKGEYRYTNTLSSSNYLLCNGDTLYHIRMNCMDFGMFRGEWPTIIYDNDIPDIVRDAKDKRKRVNTISILICVILSILSLLHFIVLIIHTKKESLEKIRNKSAHKLLMFIYIMSAIEVLLVLSFILLTLLDDNIYWLWHGYDYDDGTFVLYLIPILDILCLKYPLIRYLRKKEQEDYSDIYLIPNSFLGKYGNFFPSMSERKILVLSIYYPLYYLCSLPFGFVVLLYELLAIMCVGVVVAVKWVKSNDNQTNDFSMSPQIGNGNMGPKDMVGRIMQLKSLKEKGLISDAEYEKKKAELLSEL